MACNKLRSKESTHARTCAGGVVDEVEERLVDVEDDELEVRAALLHGVRGGAQLPVEGQGVVVEALHAAGAPAAEQGHGSREATHGRQRRHADPAGAQAVQALRSSLHHVRASFSFIVMQLCVQFYRRELLGEDQVLSCPFTSLPSYHLVLFGARHLIFYCHGHGACRFSSCEEMTMAMFG